MKNQFDKNQIIEYLGREELVRVGKFNNYFKNNSWPEVRKCLDSLIEAGIVESKMLIKNFNEFDEIHQVRHWVRYYSLTNAGEEQYKKLQNN